MHNMAVAAPAQPQPQRRGFFGVVRRAQTYRNLLYLALAFPIAWVYLFVLGSLFAGLADRLAADEQQITGWFGRGFGWNLAIATGAPGPDVLDVDDPPPAVGVVRAQKQQITQTDEFIGRIQAVGRVALVARVTAFLEKRLFDEGSEGKKHDLRDALEQRNWAAEIG